jgi:phage-related protein
MPTFTWIPSYTADVSEEPRVRAAKFGDGFEQRVADGINTIPKTWRLNFNHRQTAEAVAIRSFLKTQGGVTAFDWADPDGETLRYVCRDWSRTFNPGLLQSFSLTFEQVFGA